jgi:sugar phosphate isomerase/epimerase
MAMPRPAEPARRATSGQNKRGGYGELLMNNRREFLRNTGGAALALSTIGWAKSSGRAAGLRRLTCNSWPFRGYFDTPEMRQYRNAKFPLLTQPEFPQFLADHFGLHSAEFLPEHFEDTTPAYVQKVKLGLHRAHSTLANMMGVEIPGGLYNPNLDHERAMTVARRWIDITVELGGPSATFPLGGPKPYDTAVAAKNIAPIVAYGKKRGVRILFHNDDIRTESADQLIAVIQAVKSHNLGTCPDFGNFAPRSAAYALETTKRLMPYATNICHAKDGIAEHGKFYPDDFAASMKVTRDLGFRGKYSLEFEGLGDPIPGVKALLDKTLEYL